MEYSGEDGKTLLSLARQSIDEEFSGKKPIMVEGKQFNQARGVFVTLSSMGKLRGCIGLPYPTKSLREGVIAAAKLAAFSDPRFPQLGEGELENLKIEVSILTTPVECRPGDVNVGVDGIICEYLGYSGLLLPQVAIEYKLTRLEFLEELCKKAGLPKDKWQDKNFKLFKFQAQIFSE